MAFTQTKGKLVWGSPVYRIDLELESKRFQEDFTGTMTMYERRHESSKVKFTNIDEFITGAKDLWQQSLRTDFIQDARLARWIEEYLSELGVTAAYEEILDAIKGRYEEVPLIEVEEEVELTEEQKAAILKERDDDTYIASGIVRKIKYEIDDYDEMERILNRFLQQYKLKRSESASTKISYTHNGEETITEEIFNFYHSPIKSMTTLQTEFKNPHDETLVNVELSDFIPFDYQLLDIKQLGKPAEKVSEERVDKGFLIKWKIPELGAKEIVKIEYSLIEKMLRTLIIRDDYELTILQATEDVAFEDDGIWIDSNYTFYDKTPIIENVKILDQIPSDLTLVHSNPDVVEPRGKLSHTATGTEIIWSYTDVPALTQLKIEYELKSNPRMYREVITLIDKNESHVADVYKIMKPLANNNGYGLIYSIKVVKDLGSDIIIQDKIPKNFEITDIAVPFGIVDKKEDWFGCF
ncbi:MAG: hypothetical protein IH840_07005 [Candidatus Heimdallarchaeota archaeon]|nr:hypothetical protein [Candidatus Heimdallarchaeota archaeon]